MPTSRTLGALAPLALIGVLLAGCAVLPGRPEPGPAPGSPTRAQLDSLLRTVRVIDARTKAGGYERGCGSGQACVFGPAWSDDQDGPGGHDGCDTRNNVLARDLTDVRFKPGTRDCVVVAGTLSDPYSGRTLTFSRSDAKAVQIDHVIPLAAAWDLGAARWPPDRRRIFANDVTFNLLAVDGPDNQAKGDSTPAAWLPPNPAYHCFYAGKYLTAATRYGLPITAADRDALARIAESCA
ncbi:HNH endonuclease family protein [Rhodococcus sp. NPDC059234]|uniref:HNH endonuclease family protein n=1 Tax=Rhodococcus sp. NPDC059234 TaxID=3346781 RepID=UPI00366B6794